MPLIDHFLVVGAMPNRKPPDSYAVQEESSSAASSSSTTQQQQQQQQQQVTDPPQPKILFQFPPDTDVAVAGLQNFCFPEGTIPQRRVRRNTRRMKEGAFTPSRLVMKAISLGGGGGGVPAPAASSSSARPSEEEIAAAEAEMDQLTLQSRLLGDHKRPKTRHRRVSSDPDKNIALSPHTAPENSFVFLITGHAELRYGICIYKETIAYRTEMHYVIEPLCFCIVSTVPFLNFHLELLAGILDLPRICELPGIAADHLKRLLDEIKVAAEVQSPLPPSSPLAVSSSPALSPTTGPMFVDSQKEPSYADIELKKILLTLAQYRKLTVPEEKKPLDFFIMTRPLPITLLRPTFEEESELLQAFGAAVLFHVLPSPIVLQLLAALLLEFKVVIVSTHHRLLSSVILSLMPLLRPFEYQSSVIPILPISLFPYLEAPVPLLVGLTRQPFAQNAEGGFYIVNLHTGAIQCTRPLPAFPNQGDLQRRLDDLLRALSVPPASPKGLGTEVPANLFTQKGLGATQAEVISGLIQAHLVEMIKDFDAHCISDVGTDATTTISVFMKESFVTARPPDYRPFLTQFLETQIFKFYEDTKLREIDRRKTEQRNSLRTRHSPKP